MTTLAWPAFSVDPTRYEWWLQGMTQEHRSPLTGATQTQELPGAHWAARVEYHNLQEADCRLAYAFIGKMRGRAGRVAVPHFGRPTPAGSGGGSPTVSGSQGPSGTTLNVAGGPLSTTDWLLPGDCIGISTELYMLVASATTDGAGAATLTLTPPLRRAYAGGVSISLTPTYVAMLADDRQGWSYEPGMPGFKTFIFDLVEVV